MKPMYIHEICEEYNITNYTINDDNSIDVYGDVDLSENKLEKIPLNFNYVSGIFNCGLNNLKTLKGAPKKISGGFIVVIIN